MRQVLIYPGEDGYWVAECPSLPGCISQGKTRDEAISNIKEAIEGYIKSLEQDGLPVPEERFESMLVAVMTRLPNISGQTCIKAFIKAGFVFQRQEGSHIILRRLDPFAQLVVPDHKELDRGTLRALVRQSGLSLGDFLKLLWMPLEAKGERGSLSSFLTSLISKNPSPPPDPASGRAGIPLAPRPGPE